MTEREKIAGRIRALLVKTVENGCTEEEAISAAQMAAALLAKYNMTVDEAELRANPFKRETVHREDEIGERLWKVAAAIAELTGSRYWRSPAGIMPVEITFFGFAHEVEISHYLLAICTRAMRDGRKAVIREYALMISSRRRRHLLAYLDGMADTLARRIRELIAPEVTGTGLVVLRTSLIDVAMQTEKIKLQKMRSRGSRSFEDAYADGQMHGEKVGLNQGLTGTRDDPKQLGDL
jgi:hypothetical protein